MTTVGPEIKVQPPVEAVGKPVEVWSVFVLSTMTHEEVGLQKLAFREEGS